MSTRAGQATQTQAAASLGQAVDAAGQVFGHDAAFNRFNADLLQCLGEPAWRRRRVTSHYF